MSSLNLEQRTILSGLLARVLASAGIAASLISLCITSILRGRPTASVNKRKVPVAASPPRRRKISTRKREIRPHRSQSLPRPAQITSARSNDQQAVVKRATHTRHVSFSLASSARPPRRLLDVSSEPTAVPTPTPPRPTVVSSPSGSSTDSTSSSSVDSRATSPTSQGSGLSRTGSAASLDSLLLVTPLVTPTPQAPVPVRPLMPMGMRIPSMKKTRRESKGTTASGFESGHESGSDAAFYSDVGPSRPITPLARSNTTPVPERPKSPRVPWSLSRARTAPTTSTTVTNATAADVVRTDQAQASRCPRTFSRRLSLKAQSRPSSRDGVPRTQPYGPPYNLPFPVPAYEHARKASPVQSRSSTPRPKPTAVEPDVQPQVAPVVLPPPPPPAKEEVLPVEEVTDGEESEIEIFEQVTLTPEMTSQNGRTDSWW